MKPLRRTTTAVNVDEIEKRVARLERRYDPDVEDVFVDESCLPPPGSLVKPGYHNRSGEQVSVPNIAFPGGVIVALLEPYVSGSDNVATQPMKRKGPSRNASAIQVCAPGDDGNGGTSYDDPDNSRGWSFKPVDDMGCRPGVRYGVFLSYLIEKDGSGSDVHIESRSNNGLAADSSELWINGGSRHHNSGTTPSTLEWGTDQTEEFAELPYFGMRPMGGESRYGDWPMQGGDSDPWGGPGIAFAAGEAITIKAWIDGGGGLDAKVYLDHLVFMPTYPLGITDPGDIGDETSNFQSSALTAYGYVPTSDPASITNPTDYGGWFGGGDTVQDDQQLPHIYDPAMHFTIVSHDESDISGLFTGSGGVHVYVLCRGHNDAGIYTGRIRSAGHLTCFTGMHPLADIMCDEGGAWCWAYAGKMPLGDGPQGAFGIIQWISDDEIFWNLDGPGAFGGAGCDSVRSLFIAYVPQSPCDIGASAAVDDPFVPDESAPPPPATPLELEVAWDTLDASPEIVAWRAANPTEAADIDAYRAGGSAPTPATDEGVALTAQTAAWLAGQGNVTTELDDSWTAWTASATYATWAAANSAEETALLDYRAGTADRPTLTTEFGQGLVSETTAWYDVTAPPVPPSVPPDPAWPPAGAYPELTSDFESALDPVWHDYVNAGGSVDRFFPDPRGGGNHLLRLYTGAESAGPNPASSAAALYVFNGDAYAAQGLKTNYQGRIYLPPDWIATRGRFNWLFEWHISDGVPAGVPGSNARSCALGVWTDYTADGSANQNPMWALQYLGGNYASPIESSSELAPCTLGETKFEFEVGWSVNLDGYCNVFIDDIFVKRFSGPNLFRTQAGATDVLAWGFYNYHLKWNTALVVYWDKIAAVSL